jgi:hypothetical protein
MDHRGVVRARSPDEIAEFCAISKPSHDWPILIASKELRAGYVRRTPTTTVQAPANAPVDLNSAGKPDWRELAPLFGLIMLSLLPAGAGGAMCVANWPRAGMSGWQTLWLGMGGAFLFGGGSILLDAARLGARRRARLLRACERLAQRGAG